MQYVPNDLKKGDRVMLESGMEARIEDDATGQTRLAYVYGAAMGGFDEYGSIYATDIVAVNVNERYERDPKGDRWFQITMPEYYVKSAEFRKGLFG